MIMPPPEVNLSLGSALNIQLDSESIFLAGFLSWARKARVYTHTPLPLISYRGHGDASWELLPTLCRQKSLPISYLENYEKEMISVFRSRFSLEGWTDIEILAFSRHHGAPTRLLDWTSNPLVGLWFAISDKSLDEKDGVVFQLNLLSKSDVIGANPELTLEHADTCPRTPVHIVTSPQKISRTDRQRSIFSISTFKDDKALMPLDTLTQASPQNPIRKFPVSSKFKPSVRRLLSDLGLDAFSIYGDPDSFGKSLSTQFDLSDLKIPEISEQKS